MQKKVSSFFSKSYGGSEVKIFHRNDVILRKVPSDRPNYLNHNNYEWLIPFQSVTPGAFLAVASKIKEDFIPMALKKDIFSPDGLQRALNIWE
jgi:hypothetical protein